MFATTIVLGVLCLALLAAGAFLFGEHGFKIVKIGRTVATFAVIAGFIGAFLGGSALACILGTELGFIGGIVAIFGIALTGKSGPY